jgi:hypothetical protein
MERQDETLERRPSSAKALIVLGNAGRFRFILIINLNGIFSAWLSSKTGRRFLDSVRAASLRKPSQCNILVE